MHWLAWGAFALATLGGSGVIAGVLWIVFAQGIWGRMDGPPPDLSPEEARAWAQRRTAEPTPYTMSWGDVRLALATGRWRDVWPVILVGLGSVMVLIFLPLGVLLGTEQRVAGAVGLLLAGVVLWRVRRVL